MIEKASRTRNNQEDSFLVYRLFTSILHKIEFCSLESILEETIVLLRSSPQDIEWEEVDKLFEQWLFWIWCDFRSVSDLTFRIFRNMLQ